MALNASHVRDKMNSNEKKIFDFCSIQIQIIKEKEEKLRKEILDCKIQQEFLKSIISDITGEKEMFNGVDSIGLFHSASVRRDKFAASFYSSYLIQESLSTSKQFKERIQEAIDNERDIEHIESLIKESDYYDSLLNFAILGSDISDSTQ